MSAAETLPNLRDKCLFTFICVHMAVCVCACVYMCMCVRKEHFNQRNTCLTTKQCCCPLHTHIYTHKEWAFFGSHTHTLTHSHTQFVGHRPAYIYILHTNIIMHNNSNGTVSKPESAAAQLIDIINGSVIFHLIT